MVKLIIKNSGWPTSAVEKFVRELSPMAKRMASELKLINNIIVRLEIEHPEESEARSLYDEGIIIIYFRSPDYVGDFVHELSHQIVRYDRLDETKKVRLNRMWKALQETNGDGRIFINDHTYSSPKEVFCTIFKWFVFGRCEDEGYLEILRAFCPGAEELVKEVVFGKTVIKSRQFNLVFKSSEKIVPDTFQNEFERKEEVKRNKMHFKIKKRIDFQGLRISIENPAGSTRSGIDAKGNKWKTTMRDDYGYINDTCSQETPDELDIFVSKISPKSNLAFVVKQCDPDSKIYDEDKVIVGVSNIREALKVYQRNYDNSWEDRILEVKELTIPELIKSTVQTKLIDL